MCYLPSKFSTMLNVWMPRLSVVRLFTWHLVVAERENLESRLGRSWFALLYSIFLPEINYRSRDDDRKEMAKELRSYFYLRSPSSDECSLIRCWCSHRETNKAKFPPGQCQLHCRLILSLCFRPCLATLSLVCCRHFSWESPQLLNLCNFFLSWFHVRLKCFCLSSVDGGFINWLRLEMWLGAIFSNIEEKSRMKDLAGEAQQKFSFHAPTYEFSLAYKDDQSKFSLSLLLALERLLNPSDRQKKDFLPIAL